jgi:hypothetical protein
MVMHTKGLGAAYRSKDPLNNRMIPWFPFVSVRFVRHAVLLVLVAGLVQQINGSETAVYYSPEILRSAGLTTTDGQVTKSL